MERRDTSYWFGLGQHGSKPARAPSTAFASEPVIYCLANPPFLREAPDQTTLISIDMAYNPLETSEMIAEMESSGVDTRREIVEGILDRQDESFPLLARFVTLREHWYDGAADAWSPVCALHLLAKMKHYRAQLAINSTVMAYYEVIGDWLTEDMPYVLAHMGAGAVPTLIALMQHGDADMFVRGMTAEALVMITRAHPETKPRIVASIMDAARKESDIEVRTLLVYAMVDLADPDLQDYFRDSLEDGFITNKVFDMDDVDMVNETRHTSRGDARDPLYIFEPQFKAAYPCFARSEIAD